VDLEDGAPYVVRERHQIATFQDFCNDCGNCDTFCPEEGGPYLEKPRFFGSLAAWQRQEDRDGFCVLAEDGCDVIWGRIGGVQYRLGVDRSHDRAVFTDGRVRLVLQHAARAVVRATTEAAATEGHTLDGTAYLKMAAILDGVLDPRRVNPVNA
jgi:putative selenate reductase